MTPLNLYLARASDAVLETAVKRYGDAIRELAAANIFPGDMLFKNFGVTRLGRVVFYDYDEIQRMTEMNFRRIPPAPYPEAELASEPWYPKSEEHTSELQSLMRISYAVFCLKKKNEETT